MTSVKNVFSETRTFILRWLITVLSRIPFLYNSEQDTPRISLKCGSLFFVSSPLAPTTWQNRTMTGWSVRFFNLPNDGRYFFHFWRNFWLVLLSGSHVFLQCRTSSESHSVQRITADLCRIFPSLRKWRLGRKSSIWMRGLMSWGQDRRSNGISCDSNAQNFLIAGILKRGVATPNGGARQFPEGRSRSFGSLGR